MSERNIVAIHKNNKQENVSMNSHLKVLNFISRELDDIAYEKLSDETLDELADFFEDLGDSGLCHKDYDSSLAVS